MLEPHIPVLAWHMRNTKVLNDSLHKYLKAVIKFAILAYSADVILLTWAPGDRSGVISTPRSFSRPDSWRISFPSWYLMVGLLIHPPIFITLHLLELNFSSHLLDHSFSLSRSSCSLLLSSYVLILLIILASSENIERNQSIPSGRSFTYIRNRICPSTEPCGTPLVTSHQSEVSPLTVTLLHIA